MLSNVRGSLDKNHGHSSGRVHALDLIQCGSEYRGRGSGRGSSRGRSSGGGGGGFLRLRRIEPEHELQCKSQFSQWDLLDDRGRDIQLRSVDEFIEIFQLRNERDFLSKLGTIIISTHQVIRKEPDKGLEELQTHLNKRCWMDHVESLEILLVAGVSL